jgi:glyoxylase-like metal-dependent hydrolase (beta-lactamase superfamily II)
MYKTFFACALVTLTVVYPVLMQSQDGKTVVAAAVKAMGAENLKTLQFTGGGSSTGIGQNVNPSAPWPLVRVKTYTRQIDFDAFASNVQAIRVQNNAETPQNQVIPSNAPWAQQFDIWITPYGFLKGAMANPVTLRSDKVFGVAYKVVTFTLQNKYKVEGYINDQNLVERVRTWIDNDVLGDTLVEAVYNEYKDFGGLKVPTLQIVKQANYPTQIVGVSDAKPNVPVTIPTVPATAAAAVNVESEKIADGVYYLKGGTHHSVLVEFADHVTLIEGPQNEARSLALLAEAKKLYPNKPLTQVINTHHHFDHSGGLRTFVDAGVTIVTHEVNRPFYEKTFPAPRTLNPDRLEQSKKKPVINAVADKTTLNDGTRTLELHLVKDNPHNDGILVGFLPKEKILVEADLYTPPAANAPAPSADAPVNPNATALLTNLERLKLDFETILPLHGPGKATRADLYAFVRKPVVPISSLLAAAPATPAAAGGRGGRGGGGRGAGGGRGDAPSDADSAIAALVNSVCTSCHSFDRIAGKRADKAGWTTTVTRMKAKGAELNDEQVAAAIEYLSKTQGQQ